jgi:nucleotide-binding universal stress UspA family protein
MDRIMVGVDGSETAEKAAREAAALAERTGGSIHLVTASKRSGTQVVHGGGSESWTISDLDRATEMLRALASTLHVEVTCAVLDGDPAKAIVAEAERMEADLIVVGNRRVNGVGRVLGAVAIDVVRHAPCSVYIAKTT